MKQFLLIVFVVTMFSTPLLAQPGGGELYPEAVMRQIVDRVVRYYVKPSGKPRKVYISERRINAAWLPKIKNVEFVILKDDYLAGKPRGYIFYRVNPGPRFSALFGFGDLNPDGYISGSIWFAERTKSKVKIWRSGYRWSPGNE